MQWFKTNKWLRQQNKLLQEALKTSIPSLEVANRLDPPKDKRLASPHYRALWIAKNLSQP